MLIALQNILFDGDLPITTIHHSSIVDLPDIILVQEEDIQVV